MKRLTSLILAALLFTTPALHAQQRSGTGGAAAAGATSGAAAAGVAIVAACVVAAVAGVSAAYAGQAQASFNH